MSGMPTAAHGGGLVLNLLPAWLGIAWAAVFLVIAASHLRHMAQTVGQRRSWHACHVLMAVGMAFMYAPVSVDPAQVPSGFWKLLFAAAGLIAAVWAIGGVGRVATIVWLLTSIDLGAMLYMWSGSGRAADAALTWALAAYLLAEAGIWALDLYRRLDGVTPLISWQLFVIDGEGPPMLAVGERGSATLIGTLDISASMVAMTLGMAYMLVAMQLAL